MCGVTLLSKLYLVNVSLIYISAFVVALGSQSGVAFGPRLGCVSVMLVLQLRFKGFRDSFAASAMGAMMVAAWSGRWRAGRRRWWRGVAAGRAARDGGGVRR